jgi:GntR family transcriptional regulator
VLTIFLAPETPEPLLQCGEIPVVSGDEALGLTAAANCISVPIHFNRYAPTPLDITISLTDGVTIYRQIVNQVKYLVASGLLQPGDELPPIRTLALQLKVTPNTIVKAYGELESSGVIHKRQGSGTFVSEGRARQVALRERRRVIEQRIDALLAEAHQLNFTAEEILRMVRERKAAMDETGAEAVDLKKQNR